MLKVLLAIPNPDDAVTSAIKHQSVEMLPENSSLQELMTKGSYDLILVEGGLDLLSSLKGADPRAEVILFGHDDHDSIEAAKQGAAAHFKFPVETELLRDVVNKIDELIEIRKETGQLEKLLTDKYNFCGVVSRNPLMLDIFSLIRRIAPYFKTVTIAGETGSGKEVLAKALHASSPLARQPFLVCNCGALVESLIESELFGHLKGAFTGADRDKIGLFEAAGEGTLFLDEIGELPFSFQPHLLRVLQNGEFRRLGGNKPSRARCRIIAATNRNLEQAVKEGRFREDLYFRITPLVVKVPALRDRKDDIPLLYRVILEKFRERTGKKVSGVSRPAQSILMAYDWPGNVRELENVLEQAAMLTNESFIRVDDLPSRLKTSHEEPPAPMTLADIEKKHIEAVLQQHAGNRTKASKILGVSRRALLRKIEKFGIK
ncbi:MAG: sigma-54-dependent Fis family transcriptional regulator [Nitrospirae bacterium]|nr:sigma-54-dependent Fis family transcriptional regulator [Nitrospirota bacterium]